MLFQMNLSLLGRCLFSKCQTTAALSSLSVRQLRTFGPDRTTNAKAMPSHQSVVPESDNGQEIKVNKSYEAPFERICFKNWLL